MKIIQQENNTVIYTTEIDKDQIEKTVQSMEALRDCKIEIYEDSFSIDIILNEYQRAKFRKAFREAKRKEGIISGFKGNLITGDRFEWL